MIRVLNALILALVIFILLNFLYSNMNPEVLGYPMVFRFPVWGLFTLRSVAMPLGYVLIIAFALGMVFLAFVQALPTLFRRQNSKRQAKRIRQLEKELAKTVTPSKVPVTPQRATTTPKTTSLLSDQDKPKDTP